MLISNRVCISICTVGQAGVFFWSLKLEVAFSTSTKTALIYVSRQPKSTRTPENVRSLAVSLKRIFQFRRRLKVKDKYKAYTLNTAPYLDRNNTPTAKRLSEYPKKNPKKTRDWNVLGRRDEVSTNSSRILYFLRKFRYHGKREIYSIKTNYYRAPLGNTFDRIACIARVSKWWFFISEVNRGAIVLFRLFVAAALCKTYTIRYLKISKRERHIHIYIYNKYLARVTYR